MSQGKVHAVIEGENLRAYTIYRNLNILVIGLFLLLVHCLCILYILQPESPEKMQLGFSKVGSPSNNIKELLFNS